MRSPRWAGKVPKVSLACLLLFLVLEGGCRDPQGGPARASHGQQSQAIIGGKADLSQPAIGALTLYKSQAFCTGTLITRQLVLTAAHCISSALNNGAQNTHFRIDIPDGQGKFRSEYYGAQQLLSHPLYKGGADGHEYDLGLIVLSQKVSSPQIAPIPILRKAMDKGWEGQDVYVVGYGYTQTRPSFVSADQKYGADIPIFQIDARSFIHIDTKTQKSACHGDSGGPALFRVDGQLRVVGVTSVAYQATPSPQGNLTYCDGGAISTRPDVHLRSFLAKYIQRYSDGPVSCSSDAQCDGCSSCLKDICTPKPVGLEATSCKPCQQDSDCGQGGTCHRFDEGYRCLQACNAKSCCPAGYVCTTELSSGALPKALCAPLPGTCPELSCKEDKDCGVGEACSNQVCRPKPPAPSPTLCSPCYSSAQCGGAHDLCIEASSGMGYCAQACGAGRFCPQGLRCQSVGPGLEQCLPKSLCLRPCNDNTPCPKGFSCKAGGCIRDDGGLDGDFCGQGIPCHKDYRCITEGGVGRCVKRCGPQTGAAGSACDAGKCAPGLQCAQLSGSLSVCLEVCQNTCNNGGRCFRLARNFSACLCERDGDCREGYTCNFAGIGVFGTGACAKKADDGPLCRPGLVCKASPPTGNFCRPAQGERSAGQSCSYLRRCQAGMDCLQLVSEIPPLCFERCPSDRKCSFGGTCTALRSGGEYCMCANNSQCPKGSTCNVIARNANGTYGYCQRGEGFQCSRDEECPSEHRCDKGRCVFDPSQVNEPFPEKHPMEPPPDASSPQEPQPDGRVGPEPPASPEPPREARSTEPQPDPSSPADRQLREPQPPGRFCGCSSSHRPAPHSWLALLLLLALLQRPRRKL